MKMQLSATEASMPKEFTDKLSTHWFLISREKIPSGFSSSFPHFAPLTQVVVLLLWSMKNGRPLGAMRISQPGGRKLCCDLCCDLGELYGDGCGDCGLEKVSFTALRTWMLLAPCNRCEEQNRCNSTSTV